MNYRSHLKLQVGLRCQYLMERDQVLKIRSFSQAPVFRLQTHPRLCKQIDMSVMSLALQHQLLYNPNYQSTCSSSLSSGQFTINLPVLDEITLWNGHSEMIFGISMMIFDPRWLVLHDSILTFRMMSDTQNLLNKPTDARLLQSLGGDGTLHKTLTWWRLVLSFGIWSICLKILLLLLNLIRE